MKATPAGGGARPAPAGERRPDALAGDLAWEEVADAAGLLRAEIIKADGRRLTVYRQRAGRG